MSDLLEYKCPCCGGANRIQQYAPEDEMSLLRH